MKQKKESEKYELLVRILTIPSVIEELLYKWPKDSKLPEFRRKLRKYGFRYFKHAMDYEYFCQQHPKETKEIVLEYYNTSVNYNDKANYFGCLYSKGHLDLFDFVLEELIENSNLQLEEDCICKLLSHLLFTTKDIKYKEDYLNYLFQRKAEYRLGGYNIGIIKICSYYKFEEARKYLIEELKGSYINTHNSTWHALKQYNNPKDEKLLEKYGLIKRRKCYVEDIISIEKHDEKLRNRNYYSNSTIPQFILKLKDTLKLKDGIDIQLYCQEHANETREIVIDFYNKSELYVDQRYYLKCLDSSDNTEIFDFLIEEIKKHRYLMDDYRGIVVGSGSYFFNIYDKKFIDRYVEIFTNDKLPFMVRAKMDRAIIKLQPPEVKAYMLEILKDENHPLVDIALEYLTKNKEIVKYKAIFEKYKNDQNVEIRKIAMSGLKKIENKTKK